MRGIGNQKERWDEEGKMWGIGNQKRRWDEEGKMRGIGKRKGGMWRIEGEVSRSVGCGKEKSGNGEVKR
jgi:hypothetical protein